MCCPCACAELFSEFKELVVPQPFLPSMMQHSEQFEKKQEKKKCQLPILWKIRQRELVNSTQLTREATIETGIAYHNSTWHVSNLQDTRTPPKVFLKNIYIYLWHICPQFQVHSATQVCTGIWQNPYFSSENSPKFSHTDFHSTKEIRLIWFFFFLQSVQ